MFSSIKDVARVQMIERRHSHFTFYIRIRRTETQNENKKRNNVSTIFSSLCRRFYHRCDYSSDYFQFSSDRWLKSKEQKTKDKRFSFILDLMSFGFVFILVQA